MLTTYSIHRAYDHSIAVTASGVNLQSRAPFARTRTSRTTEPEPERPCRAGGATHQRR